MALSPLTSHITTGDSDLNDILDIIEHEVATILLDDVKMPENWILSRST